MLKAGSKPVGRDEGEKGGRWVGGREEGENGGRLEVGREEGERELPPEAGEGVPGTSWGRGDTLQEMVRGAGAWCQPLHTSPHSPPSWYSLAG